MKRFPEFIILIIGVLIVAFFFIKMQAPVTKKPVTKPATQQSSNPLCNIFPKHSIPYKALRCN